MITPPRQDRLSADAENVAEDSAVFVAYFQKNSAVPADSSSLYVIADSICVIHDRSHIKLVEVTGSASPDGALELNHNLASRRADGVRRFIIGRTPVDSSVVSVRAVAENWELLDELIAGDSSRFADSMRAIAAAHEPEQREHSLRYLSNGEQWRMLSEEVFPKLRLVAVKVVSEPKTAARHTPSSPRNSVYVSDAVDAEDSAAHADELPGNDAASSSSRRLYLKSNAPAWAMLWMNIAAELDVAPHWSVALPVYYSGFNYFTGHTKFRTFAVQPEARYWWHEDNTGWFIGAHFGLAYYNVAFGGDHRYQDHGKDTPALGGGVSGGFRFPLTADGRWSMEASVGAGVYRLDYDVFDNRHNGLIVDRRRRTFVGIDNVALSFCYRF
ncbi:MAG: DUF3575 domain-containing protein, partial [Lachnospiraceae bacterium]|nr:DUF3575 domain-containing protein [Lachnospiraceae bacterium]